MTLITHFRTQNHVVVASDSMETKCSGKFHNIGMEAWTFSKVEKLRISRENCIVALYGENILSEDELFFLSPDDIFRRLQEIPTKDSSTGVLFVEIEKSLLLYKFPEEDRTLNWYNALGKGFVFEQRDDEVVRNIDELDEKLKVITQQCVFFNEQICRQPNIGGYKFLFNHQDLLLKEFIKAWRIFWPEFSIEIMTTEEQIISVITSFYDKVYADWKLHRDCIGGDIQIAIMNQNGEIKKYSYARDLHLVEAIWPENSTPESRRGKNNSEFNLLTEYNELNEMEIDDSYLNENPEE